LIETSIEGAKGILLNISGGSDLKLFEVNEAAEIVRNAASPNANIIFGAVIDENMKDQIKVTIIATGFKDKLLDKVIKTDKATKSKSAEKKKKAKEELEDLRKDLQEDVVREGEKLFDSSEISENDFKSAEENDYLDIPTFLRDNKKL